MAATFRVFSNWDIMRVIMPSAEMKERRESTYTWAELPNNSTHNCMADHGPFLITQSITA